VLHIANTEYPPVDPFRPRDLPLFTGIDGGYDRCEFIGPSRFDLDKAERFTVEGDNVDLARDLNTFAVTPDRDFEIGYNDTVAAANEIFGGKRFAARAEFTCAFRRFAFILLNDR